MVRSAPTVIENGDWGLAQPMECGAVDDWMGVADSRNELGGPLPAVVIISFSLGGYSTGQYSTAPRGTNRRLRTDRYDISADVDAAGPVPKPRTRSGRESSSQISRRWYGFRGSDHVQITSTSTMNCTIRLSDRISLLSIYSLIIVYYISLYSR